VGEKIAVRLGKASCGGFIKVGMPIMPVAAVKIEQWFRLYAPGLLLYVRQWLDADTAGDVVQEVFIRLLSQAEEPPLVQAWLYRTARYLVLNTHRERRRRAVREAQSATRSEESLDCRADERLDAEAVQQALTRLPLEQRETIVLRIWGRMSLAEIGDVTGAPVSTVFNRYRAGLAAIREFFERSGCTTHEIQPDSA
jgi:RNA polymerase sigma-70 factor (ECF subfamily)